MKKKSLLLLILAIMCAVSLTFGACEANKNSSPDSSVQPAAVYAVSGQTLTYEWGDKAAFDGQVTLNGEAIESDLYTADYSQVDTGKIGRYPASVTVTETGEVFEFDVEVTVKKTLKLLMIGNSFSVDAIEYVFPIAVAAGVENIELGNLYIGGCSIDTHYSKFLTDEAAYTYYTWKTGETGFTSTPTTKISTALRSDWDVISFQQASHDSGWPETYEKLQYLREDVLASCSNPNVKTAFHMTWAFKANTTDSTFLSRYQTQEGMYNAIVNTVKETAMPLGFDYVIPNGTAIQNARTSWFGEDVLNRDYRHLSVYEGRFTAALTLVGALTGADIEAVEYRPNGITEAQAAVCKEAAANALKNPYEVTQSKLTEKPAEEIEEPVPGVYKFFAVTLDNVLESYVLASDDTNINTTRTNNKRHNCIGRLNGPGHMDGFVSFFVTSSETANAKLYFEFSCRAFAEEQTEANKFNECFKLTVNDTEVSSDVLMPYSEIDFEASNTYTFVADIQLSEGVNEIRLTLITEDAFKGSNIYGMMIETAPSVQVEGTEPVTGPSFDFTNPDFTNYRLLDLGVQNGFWDATKASNKHNIVNSNSKFLCTKLFTKEDLPVGSIIWLGEGWQYRPEGWLTAEMDRVTSGRPGLVSDTWIMVTEKWWGKYVIRAFNLSTDPSSTVTDKFDEANANFKIWVPIDDTNWQKEAIYVFTEAGSNTTLSTGVETNYGLASAAKPNAEGYLPLGGLNGKAGRTISFTVNSSKATKVGLYFEFASRKKSKVFNDEFILRVNGVEVASSVDMPKGNDYAATNEWTFIQYIELKEGLNQISIEVASVNESSYATNLYGMMLSVENGVTVKPAQPAPVTPETEGQTQQPQQATEAKKWTL